MVQRKSRPGRALVACVLALSVSVVGLPAAFADESAEVVSDVESVEGLNEAELSDGLNEVEADEGLQSEDPSAVITPQTTEETGGPSTFATYYTVWFNHDGAPTPASYMSAAYNSVIALPTNHGRPGYNLVGWQTSPNGGTLYAPGASYRVTGTVTFYAKWELPTCDVTFNGNGGSVGTGVMKPSCGSSITLPSNATRAGYKLVGWQTSSSGGTVYSPGTSFRSTSNVTLYAKWEPVAYTVGFNGNGGSVGTSSLSANNGSSITLPSNATRAGYKLVGWQTSANGGTVYNPGSSFRVTGNVTLYAKWEATTCTVTFDGNGGSVGYGAVTPNCGSSITLPSNATRAGYKHVGWQTSATGGTFYALGSQLQVSSNVTLYAKWEKDATCTVTFDGNGGSAGWGSVNPVCGSSIVLAANATRPGYQHVGWQTQPNGGTVYAIGSQLLVTGNITLYAKWEANVATLILDGNGGSVSPTAMTLPIGSDYQLPSVGSRAGYNLVGWQTQPNGGTVYALGSQFRIDGNTTLFAKWEAVNTQVKILFPIDDALGIDSYPTFSGTGQPGATIRVHGAARTIGQTVVGSDGTWSVKSVLWLPGGYYRIQATQTLLDGSVNTDAVTFQINETPSTSIAVQVDRPANGETTNKEYPVFSGKGHPGSAISVRSSVRELASTTVNADGTWSVVSNVKLADGFYSVVVGQVSPAGDLSNKTVEFTVLAGSSASLQITSSMSPEPGFVKFSGFGEPGAAVSIQGTSRIVGTAVVGADGKWEIVSNIAFYHGDYLLTATQTCLNLDYEVKAFLLEVRG